MIRALLEKDSRLLSDNWELARCEPAAAGWEQLDQLDWHPATVPGTVAGNLADGFSWTAGDDEDPDAQEFWFRCTFDAEPDRAILVFEGLATLAQVWLNGEHLLDAENMFISATAEVELRSENTLALRFLNLNEALEQKRPRAKWRTQLVSHRNLRFFRTALLGRMPGICPPTPPIGPWRPIRLLPADSPRLITSTVTPRLNTAGNGEVSIRLQLRATASILQSAEVLLGEHRATMAMRPDGDEIELTADLEIEDPQLWWPHTHGEPFRYPLTVRVHCLDSTVELPLTAVGFRTTTLTGSLADFEIAVNGTPVHCRGAAWMPADLLTLNPPVSDLRQTLIRCRDAGMNMLRVNGNCTYESDSFYELCDELGILVWQDFMFARMDYPTEDAGFLESIRTEARQFLERIAHRPSLTVLCGGSEIRQQAAMLGLPETTADDDWFDRELPEISHQYRPDVVYCPHSPIGGALPFHADQGVGHYFGVGGYRQPLDFAELEPPRFASECLAFAIPPEESELTATFGGGDDRDWAAVHSLVPRDNGADWSFADISDHYLSELFSVDAAHLRKNNPALHLCAARIAVGETMKRSVEVWRRNDFTRGALIWTLRDLGPGSGWGVLDRRGQPKAPFYFLKRAWRPTALYFRDRGTNGLWVGLHNDLPQPLTGQLTLELGRLDGQVIEQHTSPIAIEPAASLEWSVDRLLGGFVDANYAYRFGPQTYEIAIATFTDASGHTLCEYRLLEDRPLNPNQPVTPELVVDQTATPTGLRLHIASDRFIDYLMLDFPGTTLSDNYFPLLPGRPRAVDIDSHQAINGTVRVFNSPVELEISGARVP